MSQSEHDSPPAPGPEHLTMEILFERMPGQSVIRRCEPEARHAAGYSRGIAIGRSLKSRGA